MTKIIANYDDTWKYAISGYFESFLIFFYPDIHSQINWKKTPVPLEKELAKITAAVKTDKRHADKLFKVWLLNGEEVWILIHIEVQSQYDKNFPLRMFIYNYRAFDLHKRPVISLAILGDNNQSWRPNSYQYGMGNSQVTMEFNTVKLLDYKWEELEQSNNVFAIVVMAHLKTKATHGNLITREQWKWQLTRLLYEKGYNRKEIVDLYKVIDLMMALSADLQMGFEQKLTNYQEERQMPLLTNIERRALKRGQEIGQDKGAKENSRQNILDLLENRFGTLPNSLMTSLKTIDDLPRLKQLLIDTIKVNSVAEFEQLINNANSAN